MKLLYAIQGTGNGHIGRAIEIAPHLRALAEVDFLISGRSRELEFPYNFKYSYHGLSYYFGRRGGVDYLKSFRYLRPFQLWKDIQSCPVHSYDVIINDFEPISAWAARRNNIPVIALSHQASFFSDKVPLPRWRNKLFEYGMKHWVAPSNDYVGIHYKAYDDQIMSPIIRKELVEAQLSDLGHITVYLPAFGDQKLIRLFSEFSRYQWQVFSKKCTSLYSFENVQVYPVSKRGYAESLVSSHGLITGGGFQATSEALYLGKKLVAIPMFDQYEQKCNAAALAELGVTVLPNLRSKSESVIKKWLEAPATVIRLSRSETSEVAKKIIEIASRQ